MYGVPYTESGSAIDLFASCVSHVSALHFAKNVTLLVLCVVVLGRYGARARWLSMLTFALPVNFAYAHAVGPVMGASGGTFALLGVATAYAYERHRVATVIALIPLAVHQLVFGIPEIAVAHTVAWIVGVSAKRVIRDNTQSHVRQPVLPNLESVKRES